jgi:hypothetical protein
MNLIWRIILFYNWLLQNMHNDSWIQSLMIDDVNGHVGAQNGTKKILAPISKYHYTV